MERPKIPIFWVLVATGGFTVFKTSGLVINLAKNTIAKIPFLGKALSGFVSVLVSLFKYVALLVLIVAVGMLLIRLVRTIIYFVRKAKTKKQLQVIDQAAKKAEAMDAASSTSEIKCDRTTNSAKGFD